MKTRWIDEDIANDLRWEGASENIYETVKIEDHDHTRWESHHTVTVMDVHDETYWSAGFSQGLTEYQDDAGFWDVKDGRVRFRRVVPQEIKTYIYVDYEEDDE